MPARKVHMGRRCTLARGRARLRHSWEAERFGGDGRGMHRQKKRTDRTAHLGAMSRSPRATCRACPRDDELLDLNPIGRRSCPIACEVTGRDGAMTRATVGQGSSLRSTTGPDSHPTRTRRRGLCHRVLRHGERTRHPLLLAAQPTARYQGARPVAAPGVSGSRAANASDGSLELTI